MGGDVGASVLLGMEGVGAPLLFHGEDAEESGQCGRRKFPQLLQDIGAETPDREDIGREHFSWECSRNPSVQAVLSSRDGASIQTKDVAKKWAAS